MALKFFDRSDIVLDAGRRFEREVRLLQGVDHPHVVRPLWVGLEEEPPVYVMEWVGGGSFEDRLGLGTTAQDDLVRLLIDACRGVEALHQRGVLHRDLKPANILIDANGAAKVSDLGLARSFEGETPLTRTGQCLGTLGYMAPEQIEGRRDRVGPGTDLYALGIILFRIVAGVLPFEGKALHDQVRRILGDGVPSLSEVVPGVSSDLDRLCRDAVHVEVEERTQSVTVFRKSLEQILSRESR